MKYRFVAALAVCLGLTSLASAQVGGSVSRAVPPDKSAVGRLNLKYEWAINLPVSGRKDSITQVQTLGDQVFVQTRTGSVTAIDLLTGRVQWSTILGTGSTTETYPLAANSQFVYVANGTRMYSFHRYTGVVEFVFDLGSPLAAGMAADDTGVYCVLESRTSSSGATRLAVYDLPRPIAIYAAAKPVKYDQNGKPITDPKDVNPVDSLLSRYAGNASAGSGKEVAEAPSRREKMMTEAPAAGLASSRTPSLNSLPRISPPYTLNNDTDSPSINVLSSFRQPYRLRNDFQKDVQQSPSINTIPPSMAAALALSDLKAKTVEPPLRWEYGLPARVVAPVSLSPVRIWVLADDRVVAAINKATKKVDAAEDMQDPIAAPAGRAGLDLYVPLSSGYLVACEGTMGQLGTVRILWRATVGGINNRTPFVTEGMVYAQGDNSGVIAVDRKKGEVVWRTEAAADRILACNQEFLYVRNHQGKLLVYDAKRATDPSAKRSMPLGSLELTGFNVPVTNTASDRLLLAADNGLLLCLRDMSPKYARPMKITPDVPVNPPPSGGGQAAGVKDANANPQPMDAGAKKENKKN